MKSTRDISFISLLEDEVFLDLARNYSISDHQVEAFIAAHAESAETIRYAFYFVKMHLNENRELPASEVQRIKESFSQKWDSKPAENVGRRLIYNALKVAAVLVLVFSSTLFIYRTYFSSDPMSQLADQAVVAGDDAMIVLSDGSKHNLGNTDAHIEYNASGTEIVVKNQTEEEKLENGQASSKSVYNQVIVPFGRRHTIALSDGTKVQLNSGSKLIFPAEFAGNTREVFLKGEGFFEVAKNKEKPFIVKTNFVDLKVLGTTFNISAYDDEQTVAAVLVEGKVSVKQKTKLFGNSENVLRPGQGCFYSVDEATSVVKDVDINDFISWKDGIFRFRNQSLDDVIGRVQRYYNRSIHIEDEDLLETLISGKLVLSDQFEEVAKYLARTLEAHCEVRNDQMYILKK